MRTHADIDRRSLALACEIAARIDADPGRQGLARARQNCSRWRAGSDAGVHREWESILTLPWEEVKGFLLDESERGQRLRQSSPFCGILTPRERWQIYRSWVDDA